MLNNGLMSSKSCEWATPQKFYEELNNEFVFDLDPCATIENHKCDTFYTKEINGLKRSWSGHRVFCNPPYGKEIGKWVEKAYKENLLNNVFIVMLLPARTDTKWFHNWIYKKSNAEIRFIKGRLKFNDGKQSAPFPSMIVIYGRKGTDY